MQSGSADVVSALNADLPGVHMTGADVYPILLDPVSHAADCRRRFSTLNSLELVAVILNRNADIVFLNDFACLLLETKFDDVIGQNWMTQFIPEDQRTELMRAFDLLTKGVTEPYQTYYNDVVTRAGNVIHLHWINQFIYDEDGNVVGSFSLGSEQPESLDSGLLNKFTIVAT